MIAEQYGKIMIATGAASDSNYEQGYTLVYQAYTPASKYLTGAIDFLRVQAPDLKKIAIVHENDKFSTDVSTAVNDYATAAWYGPSVADFVEAYAAKYGEEPSYHAAGGYVAGLILQEAIERAGTTDSAAVAAALDATDLLTFFGHIKFNTTPEKHGLQEGHEMVYVQWQNGEGDILAKQIIWPDDAGTADAITR